jgi:hypothetical protein
MGEFMTIFQHMISNSECVGIKNPPTKVGGKQFGWNKENLVPSASANAERL